MNKSVELRGHLISDDELWDAMIDLHEIGSERGDTDEEIAAAVYALLEANRTRFTIH